MSPAASPHPIPPAVPSARTGSARLWQVDALRGAMLVLMTLTHVPTRFSSPAGQPLGFVSAAEGFVFLSAFMAGLVYTRRALADGPGRMRRAFLQRVLRIYLSQAALLAFLFSTVALLGLVLAQPAITNMVSYFLEHPGHAVAASLLLLYNPPLLDILPMYVLFMLASSLFLDIGLKRGFAPLLAISLALWLGAQFGLGHALYAAVEDATDLVVPAQQTGAFTVLAWQFLWMFGLWLGASQARDEPLPAMPGWLVGAAAAWALVCLVWRHAVGQVPFPAHGGAEGLNVLFDKWSLGPLRLLDFLALVVLALRFGPWLMAKLPRLRPLEVLGTASLPVFCAHLAIALLALALLGEAGPERPWAADVLLLTGTFAALYATALVSQAIDRHAARVREAYRRHRAARLSAGSGRSPPPRSRSRPR